MAGIYAEFHQNIQEKFNEGCVAIMPSHFFSLWNDDKTAKPDKYLDLRYSAPGLKIREFDK